MSWYRFPSRASPLLCHVLRSPNVMCYASATSCASFCYLMSSSAMPRQVSLCHTRFLTSRMRLPNRWRHTFFKLVKKIGAGFESLQLPRYYRFSMLAFLSDIVFAAAKSFMLTVTSSMLEF